MLRLLLGLVAALALTGCSLTDRPESVATLEQNADAGIYVVKGAVRLAGTFHVAPNECLTLDQAIKRAGNVIPGNEWNDGGDLTAVRIQRIVNGSVIEYTIDAAPGARGGMKFIILPGDSIRVPKRTFATPIANPLPYAS